MLNLEIIKKYIKKDLKKLNNFMVKNLHSNVDLITIVSNYIIQNSGKKLRPILLLLVAHTFFNNKNLKKIHIKVACAIEYIHTATLLHDDVIDKSIKRRAKLTVNKKWDNKTAILVGDFLYSKAFQIIANTNNNDILKILTKATNCIAEGEVLQLITQNKQNTTKKDYSIIIKNKTAKLFEAVTTLGATISSEKNLVNIENIKKYGYHFGIAYQILNDISDCINLNEKNIVKYSDLQTGKLTLPFFYCFRSCNNVEKNYILQKLGKKITKKEKKVIYYILKRTKSFTYTKNAIIKQVSLALEALQKITLNNKYKICLKNIIKYVFKKIHY